VVGGTLAAADESVAAAAFKPDEKTWAEHAFDSTRDALRDYKSPYFKS
jgi:hypothetical protein